MDLTGAPLLVVIMMEVAANLVDLAVAATASVKMEVLKFLFIFYKKP